MQVKIITVLTILLLLLSGYLVWDKFDPIPKALSPIETVTKTKTQTKIVTHTVTLPNGTTTVDSTETTNTTTQAEVKIQPPSKYRLDIGAITPYNNLKPVPTLTLSTRLFKNIWIGTGVSIESKPAIQLQVGVEFN